MLYFVQLKRVIEADATMTEDLIAYNIIPLDGQTMTNAIVSFPEVNYCYYYPLLIICEFHNFSPNIIQVQVRAAATALKYFQGLPQLPVDFPIPASRSPDMLDFLHYIFGFQVCTPLIMCFMRLFHLCTSIGFFFGFSRFMLLKVGIQQ